MGKWIWGKLPVINLGGKQKHIENGQGAFWQKNVYNEVVGSRRNGNVVPRLMAVNVGKNLRKLDFQTTSIRLEEVGGFQITFC
jgi:hypothetical protein